MPETLEIPALLPALPEIVLALGAMALLMVGAFRGEQATKSIDGAAILLLIFTGAVIVWLPAGTLVTFGDSFVVDNFARFLKLLALTGSAAAILMSTRLSRGPEAAEVRIFDPDPARHHRDDDAHLGG